MLLKTKEERLEFLETLKIDEEKVIYISYDGENIGKVKLKWDKQVIEGNFLDRNLLISFPLQIVPLSYCTEGCNIMVDDKFVDEVDENTHKTFLAYIQNLVDEYFWSTAETLGNAKKEFIKITHNEKIKKDAIISLRKGLAPKKQKNTLFKS